jgi:hypothetical protein
MTNRLYQETLPTVAALDDLAKVANYSLIDTLNCDPDTQASTDHHTPRQVFTSRYVPVSLTPIRNSKYVAHSKINFHEHSFADSITQSVDVVSTAKIVRMINAEMPLIEAESNYTGEVAERWTYADGSGEIGVIPSVMQAFCATFRRAQLSTDDKLNTCLFAQPCYDLHALMRSGKSDQQIAAAIDLIYNQRGDRYAEIRTEKTVRRKKVKMFYIGGQLKKFIGPHCIMARCRVGLLRLWRCQASYIKAPSIKLLTSSFCFFCQMFTVQTARC